MQEQEQEQQTTNLNITDIADSVKIIDYGFEQGAFKGLTNVRQIIMVRDRLDMFVTAATAAVPANPPTDVNTPTSELQEAEVLRKPRVRRRTA
jgi:hypothetical protein